MLFLFKTINRGSLNVYTIVFSNGVRYCLLMNHRSPTLCIVIPAFNEELAIVACLDSIAHQTELPDEVIVVDNNSTDNTAEKTRKYSFVKLVSEPQQGIAYAHRAGFDSSDSNYIARIDADTILPTNWVESIKKFYENPSRHGTTLTGSGYSYGMRHPKLSSRLIDSAFIGGRLLLGHYPAWGPNLIVPRQAWQLIRNEVCFSDNIFDDLDIALHLHQAHLPIEWMSGLRVGVRIRHLESFRKFFNYVQRWSKTLKNHKDRRWIIAATGLCFLAIIQYPLYRAFTIKNKQY